MGIISALLNNFSDLELFPFSLSALCHFLFPCSLILIILVFFSFISFLLNSSTQMQEQREGFLKLFHFLCFSRDQLAFVAGQDGSLPASSRKTSRTRGCHHSDRPLCFYAFWISHGHTVASLEILTWLCHFLQQIVALEGFLEMLPACLLPSLSRLRTLLRGGHFHSAVRQESAKYTETVTRSISKSRTALLCQCLLPCVCAGFRFPSPPVQNSLEASCQRLNKVFI